MRATTFKLRIDLDTGVAEIIRCSRSLVIPRLGPIPDRFRKAIEHCVKISRVPDYADLVGIEKVLMVDGMTEVDLMVCPLNLHDMEVKGFADSGEREKIGQLHEDIYRWITYPISEKHKSSTERTKAYRSRLRESGRQIIELRPKNENVELLRAINRCLDGDSKGTLARKLRNLVDLN